LLCYDIENDEETLTDDIDIKTEEEIEIIGELKKSIRRSIFHL